MEAREIAGDFAHEYYSFGLALCDSGSSVTMNELDELKGWLGSVYSAKELSGFLYHLA